MIFRFLIVMIAMACMIYELILAQMFSALLGNTLLRYSLTIGIYLAALGTGSLLVKPGPSPAIRARLFKIETMLLIFGALSPLLALGGEWFLRQLIDPTTPAFLYCAYFYSALLIFVVGVFAGMELPLLMHWGESEFKIPSGQVLFFDYFGTLLGVLVFIYLLLPHTGIMLASGICGLVNGLAAVVTFSYPRPISFTPKWWGIFTTTSLIVLFTVIFHSRTWTFFEGIYFGS